MTIAMLMANTVRALPAIFAVRRRSNEGWNRATPKKAEAMRGDNTAARASRLIQSRPR